MAKSLDDVRELCAFQAAVLERFLDEAIDDTQGKFVWQSTGGAEFIRVTIDHAENVPQLVLDEVAERYKAAGGWRQVDCHYAGGTVYLDMLPDLHDDDLEPAGGK